VKWPDGAHDKQADGLLLVVRGFLEELLASSCGWLFRGEESGGIDAHWQGLVGQCGFQKVQAVIWPAILAEKLQGHAARLLVGVFAQGLVQGVPAGLAMDGQAVDSGAADQDVVILEQDSQGRDCFGGVVFSQVKSQLAPGFRIVSLPGAGAAGGEDDSQAYSPGEEVGKALHGHV